MSNDGTEFRGDWRAAFKGTYLTAVEFDGRTPTFQIADVRIVELEVHKLDKDTRGGKGGPKVEHKPVVFFREIDRGWVLNKTNAGLMGGMWGDVTAAWIGKRVTLQAQMVQVGRGKQPGIRVMGSPDIDSPIKVVIKHPKKRPVDWWMQPTGNNQQRRQSGPGNRQPQQAQRPPQRQRQGLPPSAWGDGFEDSNQSSVEALVAWVNASPENRQTWDETNPGGPGAAPEMADEQGAAEFLKGVA